ncbi:hypothetical protein PIB30_060644 [Stylosanthes scabra]|uniref:Uncharacterized protein n=1 Tax=Stylosanthes scabra TaxID=79078 RepID=A0ABU6SL05_9FABA|nr:hypothetical protein [Stylosanthes scabra]
MRPVGRDDEMNGIEMDGFKEKGLRMEVNRFGWYPSRFTEPFWNEFENFVSIQSTRIWGESIRICTETKTTHLKSIRDCLESTPTSWPLINLLSLQSSRFNAGFESTPRSKFHELPRIESIRLVTEPIRFHPAFKFNIQNALRIDSSSSESILHRRNMVSKGIKRGRKGYRLGLWQQRTIGSSKCLWGSCFHVGQELTSRLTVAARGPSASVPATNLGF